ncbi:hypothetical protein F5Y13DRAFT_190326 [Hypoxylon sp. FL1857]|nr:hypothetical protein F5Y13DRAFT_190326 [Hypoxylon sp. FL1857]
MHRKPTGWRTGFAPVSQIDDLNDGNRERRSARQFRSQVQQVIQQSAINQADVQGNVHGSPAFSDTTLVAGDYLDVPIRHYEPDEVDIGDYVEYHGGYYAPEVASLSPTPSTKAGLGLEVRSWPVASDLTPGGLYVDDPWNNISYRGSEGKIEEEIPREPRNYKPPVLRGKFLAALFLALAILFALAEVAIQLLPNGSGAPIPSQVNETTTEIRRRSMFTDEIYLPNPLAFFKRQNDDGRHNKPPVPVSSASSSSKSVTDTVTATGDATTISQTTITGSTSAVSSQTASSIATHTRTLPSETQPSSTSSTSQATSFSSPSPSKPATSSTSTILPSSSTTTSHQAEPSSPSPSPSPSPTSTSVYTPPPAVTSSSEDLPRPPHTQTLSQSSAPVSFPGHEDPAPPQDSSSSSSTSDLTTSSILSSTDGATTTSQPWDPTKPGDPNPDPTTSTSLPFTLPTDPPSSYTSPPFSLPTGPDSTLTLPTLSLPTLPSPPLSTSPGGSNPDPPTSPTTSPTSLPFSSSTTTDPPSTTTLLPSSSYSTDQSSTNTNPPGDESSSTSSSSSVEQMTSTREASSSSSTSAGSATTSNTTPSTTDHISETSSLSHSESHSETSTTSSTITTTSTSYTEQPSSSSSAPFATITKSVDEQTTSPPITTTIVTSVAQSDGGFIETTVISVINPIKADKDDSVTDHVIYTDSNGRLTTETGLAQPFTVTSILTDAFGKPTSTWAFVVFRHPMQTTLTDYQGRATKTESYFLSESAETLYDKDHHPTATRTAIITEIISLITLSDDNGLPTETLTELIPLAPTSSTTIVVVKPSSTASPNSEGNKTLHVVPVSDGKYFLGLMFPTFVAIVVSIPIRMLDQTAKLYQPFHTLASGGGPARETLLFRTAGIWNFTERIRSLLNGQILLTLTGLLVLGSVIMIPLSSEAVRIILEGPDCAGAKDETLTCRMAIGIYPIPAQIGIALLAFMIVLVGLIIVVLRKWYTGLDRNPWSLYHMGHLAANNEIRTLILRRLREKDGRITHKQAKKAFAETPFIIDYWKDNGALMYSILIPNEANSLKKDGRSVTFVKGKTSRRKRNGDVIPFFILTWTGRLLFLALLCAVMIGLLIYTIMGDGQTYTRFMGGEWRVVRFIFTFIGVLISLIWGSFFYAVAFLSPHKLLHRIRLYHGDAVYMTPPSNPFSGIRSSLTRGRRDIYLGVVSATAILSEILPMLLSTALDKCTEYFWAHTVCLWMAVSLLSIMILTVAGSFFVTWPHMPIDPSTIAGGMYYALTKYMPMSPSSGLLWGRATSPGLV